MREFIVDRHRTLLTAIFIAAVVSFAAYLGYSHLQGQTNEARKGVVEIQQNSPCLAVQHGNFTRLKECRESFNRGLRTLTPLQSCHFLQTGATIIAIGGRPIPPVTCRAPKRTKKKVKTKTKTKTTKTTTKPGSSEPPVKTTSSTSAATTTTTTPTTKPGAAPKHESSSGGKQSGGHEGGSTGTSTPEQPTPSGTGTTSGTGPTESASPTEPAGGPSEPPASGGGEGSKETPVTGPSSPPTPAVKIEVLPKEGPPVNLEVLPEVLPLPVCTPVLKLNCR